MNINWNETRRFLLRGTLFENGAQVPPLPHCLLKIFVICQSKGMSSELKVLEQRLYSKLRSAVREELDLDFHLVIMDERFLPAQILAQTVPTMAYTYWSDMIADEIKLSAQQSLGVSFLLLIGEKYGETTVPERLELNLFQLMMNALLARRGQMARELQILDRCYVVDQNVEPAVMVLSWPKIQELQAEADTSGEPSDVVAKIRHMVEVGLLKCAEEMTADTDAVAHLLASALEKQCRLAISSAKNIDDSFTFVRRICRDLRDHLAAPMASEFIDLMPAQTSVGATAPTINTSAQSKLDLLLSGLLSFATGSEKFCQFDTLYKLVKQP